MWEFVCGFDCFICAKGFGFCMWAFPYNNNTHFILDNFTTNLAECWMSIRAKFDGGKLYNRSQSGAWEGRCAGAGLRQNLGAEWGPSSWKKVTGEEANPVFRSAATSYAKQLSCDQKRKSTDEAKKKRIATKFKRTNDNSLQARSDYARHDGGPQVRDVHQDIPEAFLLRMMMDYYRANVNLSSTKISELESATRAQGSGQEAAANIWMAERRKRITASACGQIAKRRATTKVAGLVKTLLYSTFRGNTATQWGSMREETTKQAYIQEKKKVSPAIAVKECGFTVHHQHNWLGASPDGLVYDPTAPDPEGVVEYKNPYSIRTTSLHDAASQRKDFCLTLKDGSLKLKRSHSYFYQIQATMFCTERKWCDFVVSTTIDLHVERITFDPTFWKVACSRLRSFYFSAILPELANPRLHKGGIREPSEWLRDHEALSQEIDKLYST